MIEPIFEREFLGTSYGFRPGKGCKDALREVDRHLKAGYTHVVDADLQGYFDSILHDLLTKRIEEHISDGRLLQLLASWLKQDIVKEMDRWTPTAGTGCFCPSAIGPATEVVNKMHHHYFHAHIDD